MKKIGFITMFVMCLANIHAQNFSEFTVTLDYSKTKFEKTFAADFFRLKNLNNPNWEKEYKREMLLTFITSANLYLPAGYVINENLQNAAYEIIVKVKKLDDDQDTDADILIVQTNTSEKLTLFPVYGAAGRFGSFTNLSGDAMKEIGKTVGKFIAKLVTPRTEEQKLLQQQIQYQAQSQPHTQSEVQSQSYQIQAQDYYEDIVYFKNGSIIRGIILEQIPNESLKIQTRDENLFVFKMDEVEKIVKELRKSKEPEESQYQQYQQQYQPKEQPRSKAHSSFNKPKGYMGLLELDGGLGVGTWSATRAGLSIINGYRAVPQFALGFGVGLQLFSYSINPKYNADNGNKPYTDIAIPFFLHLRSDFLKMKVSPYAAFNIGYNLRVTTGFFGGIFMEPTLGIGFNIGENSRMNIGLAAAINRVKYIVYYDYGGYYEGKAMGYALNLKVGFSF